MRVSVSRIKTYKACKRLYELKYIEGVEPLQKSEALETGSNYHELLEHLNKTSTLRDIENDYSKELAMAIAYQKFIFPKFKVIEAEKWLEFPIDSEGNDKLVGIVDGIADDGYIVEHKSTGLDITEQYEYNLLWDEQILAYMLMTGHRKVWYTVCRKPTIKQKVNETDEMFFKRMVDWYDTDTDSKIRLLEIERTDEEVEKFYEELKAIVNDMNHTENYYRNVCHCNNWGRRCEYSGICLNYDPNQEYLEYVKGVKEYEPKAD